jgi:hypothetical protein
MWVKMSNARHNLRDHAAVVALERIEEQYGKVRRVWLMDRGVPTEEVLAEMRAADPPVHYLVGMAKGRLTRLKKHLVAKPWQEARPGVQSLPQRRLMGDDAAYG